MVSFHHELDPFKVVLNVSNLLTVMHGSLWIGSSPCRIWNFGGKSQWRIKRPALFYHSGTANPHSPAFAFWKNSPAPVCSVIIFRCFLKCVSMHKGIGKVTIFWKAESVLRIAISFLQRIYFSRGGSSQLLVLRI